MKTLRVFLILTLLMIAVSMVSAQQPPQPVVDALAELNNQTGSNYTLSDINWRWSEELFTDTRLGCAYEEPSSGEPFSARGYIVLFDTDFDQNFEWDFRFTEDRSIFFRCVPAIPPTSMPITPQTPPTAIPLSPTPNVIQPSVTPQNCHPLISRLVIGQQGRVLPGDPNILRDRPGQSAGYIMDVPGEAVFTVLEGPVCASGYTWWQINYNGTIGWTVEGEDSTYWLEPVVNGTATPDPASFEIPSTLPPTIQPTMTPLPVCNPDLPPRLQVGQRARVTPGEPNIVREQPGTSGTYVADLPGLSVFTVLEGPVCGSGYAWWRINHNGLIGWTAEGGNGDYWLEPPDVPNPITVDNASITYELSTFVGDLNGGITAISAASYDDFVTSDADSWQQWQLRDPFNTTYEAVTDVKGNPGAGYFLQDTPDGYTLVGQVMPGVLAVANLDIEFGENPFFFVYRAEDTQASLTHPALSASGRLIGVVQTENTVVVWRMNPETTAADEVALILPVTEPVLYMAFTPDDEKVVIQFENRIQVVNLADSAALSEFDTPFPAEGIFQRGESTVAAIVSPQDGQAGFDLVDVETAEVIGSYIPQNETNMTAVAMNRAGTLFAAGGGSSLHVWDVATHQILARFDGFDTPIRFVTFSADGTALFAVSESGVIRAYIAGSSVG